MKKTKKITGVLLDTQTNTIKVYDLTYKDYKDFAKLINCDYIDIVDRKFGNSYCDIICDDEGLLKGEKLIPAIFTFDEDKKTLVEQIVGSVFLCGHDDEGNSISLTEEQIKDIETSIRSYGFEDGFRTCLIATL